MFQLWENDPASPEARCIANRTDEEVKPEYHDLAIGACRTLDDPDFFIIRVSID